ncbi:MAG: hypothetical protein H6P95_47, partial [Candidatus Aminicenantes bacterium]|nr:hypothetical protein [Candidatus Aminicenantes bacterium]
MPKRSPVLCFAVVAVLSVSAAAADQASAGVPPEVRAKAAAIFA